MDYVNLVLQTVKLVARTEMANALHSKLRQNNLVSGSIIKQFQPSVIVAALFALMKILADVSLVLQDSLYRQMQLASLANHHAKLVLPIMSLPAFLAMETHILMQLPILVTCVPHHQTV